VQRWRHGACVVRSGYTSTDSEHIEPVVDITQLNSQPGTSNSTAHGKVSPMAQLASGAEMDNTGKTGSCEEVEVVGEKQKDVIVISPTGFNPNNIPRSIAIAKVTAAKTRGNSLRVKINKLLGECTEQVALILELTGQVSENTETSAETKEEIDECH